MDLTDILFDCMSAQHNRELKHNKTYQAAVTATQEAENALLATMSPQQQQLLNSYLEELNYRDALELGCLFSRCSLLITHREE